MNELKYKNLNILKNKNLSVEELIEIYRISNNPEILSSIIDRTKKLVYKIAGEFRNIKLDPKDIQQAGFTGLIMAINRFEPKSNYKFSTFSVHCIKGEILHFIRDSKLIKVPRWIWKLNKIFVDFIKDFESGNDRYPTIEEISKGINVSMEGIDEFFKAREAAFYDYRPIDEVESSNNNKGSLSNFDRRLIKSREYKSFELVMEDKFILWDAIDKLCSLNKKIIILNYFLGLSQKEIGEKFGISQRSVSRKLKESIRVLREYFSEK